jgi:hypothetical protein
MNWQIKSFRSEGKGINFDDDMARVYIELPINEAKKIHTKLISGNYDKTLEIIEDLNECEKELNFLIKKNDDIKNKLIRL